MSHFILIFSLLFLVSCSSKLPPKPLKRIYWNLVEIHANASTNVDHQPHIHLIFHINDKTLHGNDGCNTLNASYTQEGENFQFIHIKSSKISCEEGSEQAGKFLQVLQDTNRLIISENDMFLYNKEEKIAHFEAKEDY